MKNKQIQVTLNTAINADNMKLIADKIAKRIDDMHYYPVFVSASVKRRKDLKTGEVYYVVKPYYDDSAEKREEATHERIRVYQDRVSINDAQWERNHVNADGIVLNTGSSFMMSIVLNTISDFSAPIEIAVDFVNSLHDNISNCVEHYDIRVNMSVTSHVDGNTLTVFFDNFLTHRTCSFLLRNECTSISSQDADDFGDLAYNRDGNYRYGIERRYVQIKAWESINRDINEAVSILDEE